MRLRRTSPTRGTLGAIILQLFRNTMNPLLSYYEPIVDSGLIFKRAIYSFDFTKPYLTMKYSLTNPYNKYLVIPIIIAEDVLLNCDQLTNINKYEYKSLYGEYVVALDFNNDMHGYGNDHYVTFESHMTKYFVVHFEKYKKKIKTIDLYSFMIPNHMQYGLYRIKYSLELSKLMGVYCDREYKNKEFIIPDGYENDLLRAK